MQDKRRYLLRIGLVVTFLLLIIVDNKDHIDRYFSSKKPYSELITVFYNSEKLQLLHKDIFESSYSDTIYRRYALEQIYQFECVRTFEDKSYVILSSYNGNLLYIYFDEHDRVCGSYYFDHLLAREDFDKIPDNKTFTEIQVLALDQNTRFLPTGRSLSAHIVKEGMFLLEYSTNGLYPTVCSKTFSSDDSETQEDTFYLSGILDIDKKAMVEQFGDFRPSKTEVNPDVEIILQYEDAYAGRFIAGIGIYHEDDKYGFMNSDGEIIIPAKYDSCGDFIDGYAAVNLAGKWGVIDLSDNSIIPCEYEDIGYLDDGKAVVKDNGYWGCLGFDGQIIVPFEYDHISDCGEGMIAIQKKRKWGVATAAGEVVVQPKFDSVSEFSEGLLVVKKNNKRGCINTSGELVLPILFDDMYVDSAGVIVVKCNQRYGVTNHAGKIIAPVDYNFIEDYKDGIAIVKKGARYGYMNLAGEIILPLQYLDLDYPDHGIARAVTRDGKSGILFSYDASQCPDPASLGDELSPLLWLVYLESKIIFGSLVGIVVAIFVFNKVKQWFAEPENNWLKVLKNIVKNF